MADGKVVIDVTVDEKDAKKKLNDVEDTGRDTADGLKDVEKASKDTSEGLKDVGDSADDAGKGFSAASVAVGTFVANGLSALISKLGEAVSSLFSLAEETREYREDMAKLDAAFSTAGHSTETASAAYDSFYKLLGESDRTVEAVNHLAEFTKNEQELAQWGTIAAGVTAKFGDSLPIEGLTEAANETAKVGAVTGPLADALNWAGISEDEFNKKLAACNSEQERATLITSTLNSEYAAAAEEYNKLTASAQAARDATNQMEQAQAALGAAMEPVSTGITLMGANFLSALVPSISELGQSFTDLMNGVDGAGASIGTSLSNMLTTALDSIVDMLPQLAEVGVSLVVGLAQGFVSALPQLVTTLASTVTTIVTSLAEALPAIAQSIAEAIPKLVEAIVAALPQLIQAIISLVNALVSSIDQILPPLIEAIPVLIQGVCDALVENLPALTQGICDLLIMLVGYIPDFVAAILPMLPVIIEALCQSLADNLPILISTIIDLVIMIATEILPAIIKEIVKMIPSILASIISGVVKIFASLLSTVVQKLGELIARGAEGASEFVEKVIEFIKELPEKVKEWLSNVIDKVTEWVTNMATNAKKAGTDFVNKVIEFVKNLPSKIGEKLSEVITKVDEWATDLASKGAQAATDLWNSIVEGIKSLPDKLKSIGEDVVAGFKKGIENAWKNLKKWFEDLFGDLKAIAKKILGIKSPSREFMYIGEMTVDGFAKGVDTHKKAAISSIQDMSREIIAEMVKGVEAEIEWLEKLYDEAAEKRNDNNKEEIAAKQKALKADIELAKERLKVLKNYESTLSKQLDEFTSLQENYESDAAKIQDNLAKNIEKTASAFESAYDRQYNSIRNSYKLFDEAQKGDAVKGRDLIKNLKSQVDVLEDYNAALDTLSGKGVNQEFIDELKAMGVDALPEIEAINKMSQKELEAYVKLWEEKNAQAYKATDSIMATQEAETLAAIIQLKADAKTELTELTTTFNNDLITLTESMSASMKETGEAGLIELSNQIDGYTQMGRDLMQGVAEGISDKESVVIDMLVDGVRNAIEAAKKEADIHSPSKATKDELGANLALGVGAGWEEKINKVKSSIAGSMSDLIARAKIAVAGQQARYGSMQGGNDSGFNELMQAVGIQTAGINNLANSYNRGASTTRPVVIELNGRELGRAMVDVGGAEETRIGAHLAYGGAK